MGFRISWLAAEMGKRALLDALGFVDTGQPDEVNEAHFSVAELPTGWTILWANDEGYAGDDRAATLSRRGLPVLAVRVNETCMHSTAADFVDGATTWRLHHDGDERIDVLEKQGALPSDAAEIKSNLRARQADEDAGAAEVDHLFDVPLEVTQSLCGFKHDVGPFAWGEPAFVVARPLADSWPRIGVLRRRFGGHLTAGRSRDQLAMALFGCGVASPGRTRPRRSQSRSHRSIGRPPPRPFPIGSSAGRATATR